jgi:hypothetical protein
MSFDQIVTALGPGKTLSTLNKYATSYQDANKNFDALLRYPFLQDIVLADGTDPKADTNDLHTIVADGSSRFNQLCTTNVSIAQQAISYGRTVSILLKSVDIAKYVSSVKPLVDQYINQAKTSASDNKQFFEDVCISLLVTFPQV